MKKWCLLIAMAVGLGATTQAATVNWSAGIDHGFSLENGSELPVGSLVRLGWFRDPTSGMPLTDSQIQALKTSTADLNLAFVEVGATTIGSGFTPVLPGHFSAVSPVANGLNMAGKQMFIWVLNAATVSEADEQAILYWSISNTAANPDGTADSPGLRWRFPEGEAFPGSTTIDVTDLTVGTGSLGAGARLLVGRYPNGTSSASGAANFGLENLYQPPIVSTQTVLAGGSVGVVYRQELAAIEGMPSFTWDVIGGELPNGLVMSSAGVITGRPTFAGVFTFIGRARDLVGSSVSREFRITIGSVPLLISDGANLPDAGLNNQYALNLQAEGGTAPYTWSLQSGVLPNGMTLSDEGLLAGTPTESGVFSFLAKCVDAGGLEATRTFQLQVLSLAIVTPSALPNGIVRIPYQLAMTAVGGRPPYTWSLVGGALPTSALPGTVLEPTGILTFTPTAEAISIFTLEVRDSNNVVVTREFTLEALRVGVVPTINAPVFPEATVGAHFTFQLSGSYNAVRFSAVGLPRGLVLNPLTGVISGRPVGLGVYPVTVRAANSAGRSRAVVANLAVRGLIGAKYIGSIAHNTAVNGNIGGRLDLTTTRVGSYSLKLTHGGAVKIYKGRIEIDEDGKTVVRVARGTTLVVLTVEGDLVSGKITEGGLVSSSAAVYGWRSIWNETTNPAISRRGYYSIGIDILSVPLAENRPLPEGTGYAYFDVKRNGTLTVRGKAADGSTLITPGFIGPSGEILVHTALYSRRGSVTGRLQLTTPTDGDLFENTVEGALTWIKPVVRSRTYPDGFGPLTLSAYGKYLARAGKGWIVSGLPEANQPAQLNFAGGGIEDSATNPSIGFTFTDRWRVIVPLRGGVDNPGRTLLRMPFVPVSRSGANGLVSGTFQLTDGTRKRTAKYQGIVVRGEDEATKAYGYFMLPQLPIGNERPSLTPILSGQVTISQ